MDTPDVGEMSKAARLDYYRTQIAFLRKENEILKDGTLFLSVCGACGSETASNNQVTVNKYIKQLETASRALVEAVEHAENVDDINVALHDIQECLKNKGNVR